MGQVGDAVAVGAVIVAVQDVGAGVVEVHALLERPVAERADRGQGHVRTEVDVGLGRHAEVLDLLRRFAVRIGRAAIGQHAKGRVRRALALAVRQGVDEGIALPRAHLHRRAAELLALGVVGDQPNGGAVVGQKQQLPPRGPVILGLVLGQGARAVAQVHVVEAVAFALGHEQPAGDLVGQGAGDGRRSADRAIVAAGQLGLEAGLEGGLFGDDVDDAGRGVLAEQCALRPLQHLDAAQLAQVAEADRVARAVDAVDDHADRAFKARIVAHGARAANTDGGGGLRLGRGDRQAGRQDLQILDVLHARAFQQRLRQGGDHDGHLLQALLALLGGDDDVVDGGRLVARVLGAGGARKPQKRGADYGGGHGVAKRVAAHGRPSRLAGRPPFSSATQRFLFPIDPPLRGGGFSMVRLPMDSRERQASVVRCDYFSPRSALV